MQKRQLTTLLLAAALLAPTAALAHGGDRDGDRGDRGRSERSSVGAQGDRHGKNHQYQGRGEGHVKARHGNAQGKSHGHHGNANVKAASEVRQDSNHENADQSAGTLDDSTPSPTATPTATASPAAEVRIVGFFKLNGTVDSTADGSIVVNGQTIVVDPDKTKIKHGPLAAGQTVKVQGYLKSDGTFVARQVKVRVSGAEASPEPSASPSAEPTLEPSAEPTSEPSPVLTPAASPTAEPTDSPSPSPTPTVTPTPDVQVVGTFTLRGKITAVNEDSIELNGQTIMITDDTKVHVKGDLQVGQTVLVKGGITTDGELVGKNVNRQNDWFFVKAWRWFQNFWS